MQEFRVTLPWPPKQLSSNARLHWSVVSKAKAEYRKACWALALADGAKEFGSHWPDGEKRSFHMDFYPPNHRRIDDANTAYRMKAGVDGVADALGVDDRFFRTSYELHDQIGGYVKVTIKRNDE